MPCVTCLMFTRKRERDRGKETEDDKQKKLVSFNYLLHINDLDVKKHTVFHFFVLFM